MGEAMYIQIQDERYYLELFGSKYPYFRLDGYEDNAWVAMIEHKVGNEYETVDAEGSTALEAMQKLYGKLNG